MITDSFSSGWRVFNLSNKNLQNYRIYPANYTLKAIPLKRGEHHIRIEYLPGSFVIGRAVTLTSLIIYLGILFLLIKKPILRRSGEKNMGSQVYEND